MSDPKKRVQNHDAVLAMQPYALGCKFCRKRCRMWPLLRSLMNGLVRNEPVISSASLIFTSGMQPAANVAFIGIWNANCQTVNWGITFRREMKYVLVAVV